MDTKTFQRKVGAKDLNVMAPHFKNKDGERTNVDDLSEE